MTRYGELNDSHAHPHILYLENKYELFECNKCKEVGYGKRYECHDQACGFDFHLHMECAQPSPTIRHPFFGSCLFYLTKYDSDGWKRFCDACGGDIKGWHYNCECNKHRRDGKDLHICCATQKRTMGNSEVKLELKKELSSRCQGCGQKEVNGIKTWAYVSDCKQYCYHIYCVKKMVVDRLEKIKFGSSTSGRGGAGGVGGSSDDPEKLALVEWNKELELVKRERRGGKGRSGVVKRIAKFVLAFIVAVVVGDPTALLIGFVTSFISR